ncbi:unnamed protein product, partial [Owenia fusiformis]
NKYWLLLSQAITNTFVMLLFTLLAVCLVSYASCDQATDELAANFESTLLAVPKSKWPTEFTQKFSLTSNYGGNGGNWCCKDPRSGGMVPAKTVTAKKVGVVYKLEQRQVKIGYIKGNCMWSNCVAYGMRSFVRTEYIYKEELVTAQKPCNTAKRTELTCCLGYVKILNYCLERSWVAKNDDLIRRMQDLNKRG